MTRIQTPTAEVAIRQSAAPRHIAANSRPRSVRDVLTGLVGAVVGLAPHVLHHVGLLAGTALVAGSGGTALFAVVGLLATIPMLRRLHRRFGTLKAPAIGLAVFAAMFALSAFVIGPAISSSQTTNPSPTGPSLDHSSHH